MKKTKNLSVANETLALVATEVSKEVDAKRNIKENDSEGLLAAIVQFSQDAIISKTLEGIITSWNPAAEKLFGYTATEIVGQPINKIVPKDRLNEQLAIFNKLLEGETISSIETQRVAKNGNLIDVSLTISPIKDKNGNVIGVLKIYRDISKQIEANEQIEDSELFSHTILESSPDCVKIIDTEGRLQYMNHNGTCIMEIDDFETVKNKPWVELWGKENSHLVENAINDAMQGKTASFQALCPTAKGTPKWWDVLVSPVVSPGSNKINRLISVSRDVTEQLLAQKKIEESEILHRQIFEFSPVAIWEKDDTALYQEIELLKQKGISDFRKYLDKNPAEIFRLVSLVKLEDVNNESVDLLQAASKEEVITSFHKFFTEESIPMLKEGIIGVAENKKRLTIATVLQSLKGKRLEILISFDFRIGNDLNKSLVSLTDITEQVEARKKIEKSEDRFRTIFNTTAVSIWVEDFSKIKKKLTV